MTLGAIALTLILLNVYTDLLDPVRARLANITTPVYWLVDLPGRGVDWVQESLATRSRLQEENAAMKAELLIHKRKLQQMASLAAENVRLRRLLNSAEKVPHRVLVAELIGVSSDPLTHRVVVNKGSRDGVFLGQPLLDAQGLMGQVVEVSDYSAQVLLITDASHALPVQINRNGVRAVAEGTGDLYRLDLRHLANTVDVRQGDLLVSSGLGQRFPVGYPVAEVVAVIRDPGKPFSRVEARPMAQLNRSRHVLLVFSGEEAAVPPAPAEMP
ncbi:rod shape-determining protein MreC [Pseudomaricurvus alkylphenolicus]|jgi:rod shape-determining protein MreC|uniref:rod shape-determining protein MreC n=1 Tax=Pseudomaricurvus alkylphenolicus TaxID=1306991 RepID=UPI001981AC31|nr:rod shape-determining protein MreC [Pseudomaricurvus alkylphenolicus]